MRSLSGDAITAINSGALGAIVLVEMLLSSPLRLSTSGHDVVYDGETYTGAGKIGQISEITDANGEQAGLRFTLSGIPSGYIAIALGEDVRGKPCVIYTAIVSASTGQVLDVSRDWVGSLDKTTISRNPEGLCTINVTAEHKGVTFARPKPLRYTDSDQKKLFTGDTSMRFCVSQAQQQDVWPAKEFFR